MIPIVRGLGLLASAVVTIATAGSARADALCTALDTAWPSLPQETHHVTVSQMVTDELTEVGNELGKHVNVLSHDVLSMEFDVKNKRAKVKVGAGDAQYASFAVSTDVKFSGTTARVKATIDVGFQGRRLRLDLPEFEMMPQSYQGDRVVVLLVPIVERRW